MLLFQVMVTLERDIPVTYVRVDVLYMLSKLTYFVLYKLLWNISPDCIENVVSWADMFMPTTDNKGILVPDLVKKNKRNTSVRNIGHFNN